MDLPQIKKEIDKMKIEQAERLEEAYRQDERNKIRKEIRHEMLMIEHRQDLSKEDWWATLKEILSA